MRAAPETNLGESGRVIYQQINHILVRGAKNYTDYLQNHWIFFLLGYMGWDIFWVDYLCANYFNGQSEHLLHFTIYYSCATVLYKYLFC